MEPCPSCGKRLTPEVQFCPWCGVPVSSEGPTSPPSGFPAELRSKLDQSLQAFAALLKELESGSVSEDEFSRRALEAGIVKWENLAWILDLEGGTWWCYDGIRLEPAVKALSA